MDLQLRDKLAVITGSTGDGIGFTIAKEFLRYGAHVVINGRSQSSVDKAVKELHEGTGVGGAAAAAAAVDTSKNKIHGVPGDISTQQGVQDFIKSLDDVEKKINKPVEILINNVGIFHSQDFFDVPDEKWDEYYQVNTMSGMRLSRHYLSKMLERNLGGRILFISSECGLRPLPHMLPYSVSKTSQIALARGMAELTQGTTVTVNSILPGPTMTGGVRAYMEDFGKQHGITNLDEAVNRYFKEHETTSLLQRFLDPKEIANVVVFISSPLASGISGSAQHVDGGIIRHLS